MVLSPAAPTTDDEPDDEPDIVPDTAQPWRPIERWIDLRLVTVGVVVVLVRYWFAADRRVFHVVADEPGQLAMARWLSGGTRWNMFDHSTWRPGYSVLIAPVYWLVDTGEGVVRGALTVNAVLAGVSAVVLVRLLVRWTADWRTPDGRPSPGPWTCAAIGGAVALAPAAIAASAYTWAEPMVTCTFLVTVWWAQRFVDSMRLDHALAAVCAAAVAMTTHGRSLAVLPTVILLTAGFLGVQRRWRAAGAVVGWGALLGLASLRFTDWVHDHVWDDPAATNTPTSVTSRLDAPGALLESFVGQAWYQLVASLGLVGVGTAVVVAALWRPEGRVERRSAVVLLATIAPLAMTSVTFMSGRDRSDQLVYGRYVDAVVWPLAALGAAVVVRQVVGRRRGPVDGPGLPVLHGTAATLVAFGAIVAWRHGDQLADDVGLRMMVPGLLPYIGSHDGIPVLRVTLLAVGAFALVVFAARWGLGKAGLGVATVGLVAAMSWSGIRVHDAQTHVLNTWAIGDEVVRIDEIVPPGERIGVVMVPDAQEPTVPYGTQRQRYQVYQLYLLHREIVREQDPERTGTRFVLAPTGNPELLEAGGTVRWTDPRSPVALYELPERDGVPSSG